VTGDPRRYGDRAIGRDGWRAGREDEALRQRERLVDAFTKLAAERGLGNVTAQEVAAAADLPPDIFYENFADERQCLSAAYDAFVERLVSGAEHAIDLDEEWPQRVNQAVGGGLAFISETANRSRFFAVDALAVGPLMLDRYVAAMDRIVRLLRSGRGHFSDAPDLPAILESVLVGGIACVVGEALLAEEDARILELQPELVEILLTPYLGRTEARRIALA
jgi:AcrR family transcriptional regulator